MSISFIPCVSYTWYMWIMVLRFGLFLEAETIKGHVWFATRIGITMDWHENQNGHILSGIWFVSRIRIEILI